MLRTLLSNRSKNDKATPPSTLSAHQNIKSIRIAQKILNNFHLNSISKDKSKANKLQLVHRKSQCLKTTEISEQELSIITNSSVFRSQCFKSSFPSSKFYKRERKQQEQHNEEDNNPSFTEKFGSFPTNNRSLAERHRRIKRMRSVVVSDRNMDAKMRAKTDYDEQEGEHGDSFIFRPIRATTHSEDKMEQQGPPQKGQEMERLTINLTTDRILLPKHQRRPMKVIKSLRKVQVNEDVLGAKQHPYSCILKPPQRFYYGKFSSTCQQLIKSAKRP